MNNTAIQVTKMLVGAILGIGCLALVGLQKKLGIDLDDSVQLLLIGAVVGGGGLAAHGAYKTPAPDEPPPPQQ